MTDDTEKLLAEFEEILDRFVAAGDNDDDENAIKYGREYCDFIGVHWKELHLTEENVAEARQKMKEYIESRETAKIATARCVESKRRMEKARAKYYDSLLKQTPDDKNRTAH